MTAPEIDRSSLFWRSCFRVAFREVLRRAPQAETLAGPMLNKRATAIQGVSPRSMILARNPARTTSDRPSATLP